MRIYVALHPRDGSLGTYDVQARFVRSLVHSAVARPRDAGRGTYDVSLYGPYIEIPEESGAPPPPFPTQFFGLRVRKTASTIDLCLVAEADAPAGMGGVIKINKNGTYYAAYLVETVDADASPVRVQTTAGVKSIRLKT